MTHLISKAKILFYNQYSNLRGQFIQTNKDMSWLSKIIKSNPKSKKEQLKKKAKLLETSRGFEATFKEGR